MNYIIFYVNLITFFIVTYIFIKNNLFWVIILCLFTFIVYLEILKKLRQFKIFKFHITIDQIFFFNHILIWKILIYSIFVKNLKIYINLRNFNFQKFKLKTFLFYLILILIILYYHIIMILASIFICFLHTPHDENINENFNNILINFYLNKFNLHNSVFVVTDSKNVRYNSFNLY